MRTAWLASVLLAAGLLLQLTVLNGLHLPGGGVPDLVLILLVAVAITAGPVPGTVAGFAIGLSLDLAPPGSGLIGQYALVFCLAGWAAGQLAGNARRMPLRTLAAGAVVIAAAEAVTAGLGLLLHPAQVTVAEIRQLLPVTIAYDFLVLPFGLYVVMLAATVLAGTGLGRAGLASTGLASTGQASRLAGTGHSALRIAPARRTARRHRPHEPRLNPAAARAGDGWVGGGQHRRAGSGWQPARVGDRRRRLRLHPGSGVAGSASGLVHSRTRPAPAVNLRFAAPRRHDGAVGNIVGRGQGGRWQHGGQPGSLAGTSGRFRPHAGEISGSAAREHALTGLRLTRAKINFTAHRGDGSLGSRPGTSWARTPARASRTGPRMRTGASRSALALVGRPRLPAPVPRLHFRTASPPVVRRPVAAPKFRHGSRLRPSALTTGLVAGGVLEQSTFRARRRIAGSPRLRLASRRPGAGMLGGSGRSPLRRPPTRSRRQPRFSYGRRSPLSVLTGRRIGGRWLARTRVGRRSGVWLIGRRTGGMR
jgi:rod shape-determining protein MreD